MIDILIRCFNSDLIFEKHLRRNNNEINYGNLPHPAAMRHPSPYLERVWGRGKDRILLEEKVLHKIHVCTMILDSKPRLKIKPVIPTYPFNRYFSSTGISND